MPWWRFCTPYVTQRWLDMDAGKLRHRIQIQTYTEKQDTTTGAMTKTWSTFATVWASIEPLSAKEFIAARVEQSKIALRIVIRYLGGVEPKMRAYHEAKDKYYSIEGVLSDRECGLEYLTLPCSEIDEL